MGRRPIPVTPELLMERRERQLQRLRASYLKHQEDRKRKRRAYHPLELFVKLQARWLNEWMYDFSSVPKSMRH